ncbi:NAD(P)/FAD-dependent oxidoreductase [Cystobacter fuscus]|uniref:NAD(P)/FAD-dependent oxidoreductase n=1 Tax=Cystobacter fuscus TaxID=43 RepID=UPI002B30E069|nr:NAD(P)/FAD-dependent oxidoreductase [Cystobacter fuscus]
MSKSILEADVAIVGAGPAGTAAALRLGQLGVKRVVLVDRADFPRDKTCGSGVSPKGIGCLKTLGVWDAVEPHAYWIKGLRLTTRGKETMFLSGGEAAAAIICNRRTLDEILLRRAQSLGVEFVPNFLVRSLLEEGGRVVGFQDDEGREVRARYTVVADGGHSKLVPERGPKSILQAIMGWWEGVEFTPHHVEMIFDPRVAPWYVWLFPENDTRVNIGICYRDDAHQHNARALFQQILDSHFAPRLRGARQIGGWKGHPILYSYAIEKLHSPGRVVIGEAGRMVHPATGEGIYQGMRSGILAAEALRDVLTGASTEARAFERYESRCRLAYSASFAATRLLQPLIDSPVLDTVAKVLPRSLRNRVAAAP